MPQLQIYQVLSKYIRDVSFFLEENEAENSLFLGQLGLMNANPPAVRPFMAAAIERGEVQFAAFYRERNLIVSRGSLSNLEPLAQCLFSQNVSLPGVIGPKEQSEEFANVWAALRGCESKLAMDQLLYQLDQVVWPNGIKGSMRLACVDDLDLTTNWSVKFIEHALSFETTTFEKMKEIMTGRIANKMIFLWEVDGVPVSMAAHARPSRRGMTVNLVYTPQEHRKKGYATALVAAVSQEALNRGKEFCALYTDLANPTSNSIYQKIGYRKVSESRNFFFTY